ncbi:MAG: Bifunctional enzyme CysN/CysC [Lentisphaerae bacterium ADurb.Bin082]|nr:MAG: Bifunctional enzyme CysN/CysC [Lentisphaerae bacterium ADurb.Bin082]
MIIPDADLIQRDIEAYLEQHRNKDLLRFLTCGNVDDGKSTLIGRLLYDAKMIYEDQLAAVHRDSKIHGTTGTDFDPALLTDGLKAEREQGITIDVAYRYFSTSKRKFIIADTPGHEQYTRNMATGASNCQLAVILIDARHGVTTQTRRHSFIASLLGISHVIVAVNKMDLVDWSEAVYDDIRKAYNALCARLSFKDVHFIPISALLGDNVVDRSPNMPWHNGPTLLHHLENVNISAHRNLIDMRFPVQSVFRPDLNFRGFAGTVASGVIRPGDKVMVLPSRQTSTVKSIISWEGELAYAFPPMPVVITLADEIDASRGDIIAPVNNLPRTDHEFDAMLVWMNEKPAREMTSYLVKHTTAMVPATLEKIRYEVDVNNMRKKAPPPEGTAPELAMNSIARVKIILHRPLVFDPFTRNHATGSFILIDRITNATIAAGMILDRTSAADQSSGEQPRSTHITRETSLVSSAERELLLKQRPRTVWLTGLSGSGKSTIAKLLERMLIDQGKLCYVLDGDNIRHGLNRDLGFTAEDRKENIRRIAEVAKLMNDAGLIVITAFISPYREDRQSARDIIGHERFLEAYLNTPLDVCEERDPKGLYRRARKGEITSFTGVSPDAPYEPPAAPDIMLDTTTADAEQCARILLAAVLN